jgi:RNA polymerase sigma factor (TIGR02999 family)
MDKLGSADITRLLHEWRNGDPDALDRLMPIVYQELHALAARQLAREWRHDRLQPTTVVHEAYVRLFDQPDVDWQNRGHFFAIAAQVMRRILVDHARRELRDKRGGRTVHLALDDAHVVPDPTPVDVVDTLALDRALQELERLDPDQSRIVELRFFGGLTVEETASVVEVSSETVIRDWQLAKAWLRREMRARTSS